MFKEIDLIKMILLDKKPYNKFVNNFTDILLKDYRTTIRHFTYKKMDTVIESPFLKDKMVKLKTEHHEYECTYGNALSIIILFTTLNKIINRGGEVENLDDFIFDPSQSYLFEDAMDLIYENYISFPDIKNIIFESMSQLAKVSAKFVSGTISLRDIYLIRKNNPEFEQILNFSVKENESFSTMIEHINNNRVILKELLTSIDSSYRPMILSGSGFNFKQASQIFNFIGPKPDIFGNIHKHPILTNFLNGLRNVDDYYVNADNCRKALITNFTAVKDSGYLTRILSMLCLDTKISDQEQCDVHLDNLVPIFIRNEFILKKYQHRNMWNGEKFVKVGMNRNLIGKIIRVASPMTCTCKDGICKTCYGNLHKTISSKKLSDGRVIKANIGLIAVLLLTEVLTQRLLSTKHFLEAQVDKLNWNGLENYFDIFSNDISLKSDFNLNCIKVLEFNENDYITKLSINDVEYESPVPLELSKNFNLTKEDEEFIIEPNNKEEDDYLNQNSVSLFSFTVKNKELSDPLNKINSLLNSSKIQERDIEGNINYMMELLDIVGFKISSEHIEVIMRELILIDDRQEFAMPLPKYEFVSAKSKVLKDSITKSLLFERLENQILNINTYYKNNKDSLLDFLL